MQESIFKLFLNYFWNRLDPEQFEQPLHGFKHVGPDGKAGLYSRNNRRLIALLMVQAVWRDKLIRVPCRIYADDDPRLAPMDARKSLAHWFRESYDTRLDRQGYRPRSEHANHRGCQLLNPAQTTLQALSRASVRARSQPGGASREVIEALDIVRASMRTRVVQVIMRGGSRCRPSGQTRAQVDEASMGTG
jgi:hypothetical protein